jgi:hypothetical protein
MWLDFSPERCNLQYLHVLLQCCWRNASEPSEVLIFKHENSLPPCIRRVWKRGFQCPHRDQFSTSPPLRHPVPTVTKYVGNGGGTHRSLRNPLPPARCSLAPSKYGYYLGKVNIYASAILQFLHDFNL